MERFIRGSFKHEPYLNFYCTLFVAFFISSVLSLYEILCSCFQFDIEPLKAESLKNQIYLTYIYIIGLLLCIHIVQTTHLFQTFEQ